MISIAPGTKPFPPTGPEGPEFYGQAADDDVAKTMGRNRHAIMSTLSEMDANRPDLAVLQQAADDLLALKDQGGEDIEEELQSVRDLALQLADNPEAEQLIRRIANSLEKHA